jgi:hypothetical protein
VLIAIIEWLAIVSLAVAAWAILRQAVWMTQRRPGRHANMAWRPRNVHDAALANAADSSGADTNPHGMRRL